MNNIDAICKKCATPFRWSPGGPQLCSRCLLNVSQRELEVIFLVAQGKTNKEIAQNLNLVEATVQNHLHSVYAKLGVTNRVQAVLYVITKGWFLHFKINETIQDIHGKSF